MILNNRGWGIRDMIIYLCILILFLLFAAYSVNTLYESIEKDSSDKNDLSLNDESNVDLQYYRDLEYKLNSATFNYLINYYSFEPSIVLQNSTIDVKELIEHEYIDELYDQFGNGKCDGYSLVDRNDKGNFTVRSYISCSNYKTEGY